MRLEVAENKDVRLEVDKNKDVRLEVAENQNTSPETLEKMSQKENDIDVLKAISDNTNISNNEIELLENKIIDDLKERTENSTNPDELKEIANEAQKFDSVETLLRVVNNQSTDIETLKVLENYTSKEWDTRVSDSVEILLEEKIDNELNFELDDGFKVKENSSNEKQETVDVSYENERER